MKRFGPLLTLLAVAVLGAVLFVANRAGDPANAPAPAAAAATTAPAPGPDTAAPTTPAPEPPVVAEKAYTGRSSGNEVTVAIAVKDGRAVAYVCDGKKIEAWLEGTLEGDQVQLTGADGATITGTVSEANSLGTVAVAGKQWPYAAKAVKAPGGLYEGRANIDGVANRIGWIVLNDGEGQVGIVQPAGGDPRPAPPLDPTNPGGVVLGGVPVAVTAIDGGDSVVVR